MSEKEGNLVEEEISEPSTLIGRDVNVIREAMQRLKLNVGKVPDGNLADQVKFEMLQFCTGLNAQEKEKPPINQSSSPVVNEVGPGPLGTGPVSSLGVDPSTGARSKFDFHNSSKSKKVRDSPESSEMEDSSADTDFSSSVVSSVVSNSTKFRKRRKVKSEKETSSENEPEAGHNDIPSKFAGMFSKFDARTAPKPEPYDIASGRSLVKFFENFEAYCCANFKCNKNAWIPELGRYLVGQTFEVFEALRGPDDGYHSVKTKLLKWFSESKRLIKMSRRALFSEACRHPNESLYVYAVRLEKLFRGGFPSKDVKRSHTLRKKFVETVPADFRQMLETMITFSKVGSQSVKWSNILKLATVADSNSMLSNPKVEEVECLAISGPQFGEHPNKMMTDAMTQASLPYFERSPKQLSWLSRSDNSNRNSCKIQKGRISNVYNNKQSRNDFNPNEGNKCSFCKRNGHFYAKCWRRLGLCLKCGSSGHFRRDCRRDKFEHGGNSSGNLNP